MRDVQRGAERNSWWQFSDLGEAGSEGRSRCAWDRGVSLQCKPLVLWAKAFKKSGRGRGAKTVTQQQLAPHTQTKHNAHRGAEQGGSGQQKQLLSHTRTRTHSHARPPTASPPAAARGAAGPRCPAAARTSPPAGNKQHTLVSGTARDGRMHKQAESVRASRTRRRSRRRWRERCRG